MCPEKVKSVYLVVDIRKIVDIMKTDSMKDFVNYKNVVYDYMIQFTSTLLAF